MQPRSFDCVTVGLHGSGDGAGHTAVTSVEVFSGHSGAPTTLGQSREVVHIGGDDRLMASFHRCRMRNCAADPFTTANPNARARAVACFDRDLQPYER